MKHPETAALARAAREATGLSRELFAALIWSSKRSIANWEDGLKPPVEPIQLMLHEIRDGWRPAQRARAIKE